jgi:hypothetical protein
MHRYEVTTQWCRSGYSNRDATRTGKIASRYRTSPEDAALSFSLDKWQALVAMARAAALLVRRVGVSPTRR